MNNQFTRIGLMSRRRTQGAVETLNTLLQFLTKLNKEVFIESKTAADLAQPTAKVIDRQELGKHCDLVIVIGGDGSLLQAAHSIVDHNIPVLGINRGRLGFLADIPPQQLESMLNDVLSGQYTIEERFLLTAKTSQQPQQADALNDVVFSTGDVARMIEFEVSIDGTFVYSLRADGLIVATPTGSTAYALSGGGPILYPSLEALVLVPMFPHTLSARPIVIDAHSNIKIKLSKKTNIHPVVSLDGQTIWQCEPGSEITVSRKKTRLKLVHPLNYDYFNVLRTKLEWGRKLERT